MDALLKNGFSDIRCCYHSNIYQMYIKYCSVCIYMVNDQYEVHVCKPKCILICGNLYNAGTYTYMLQFFFFCLVCTVA